MHRTAVFILVLIVYIVVFSFPSLAEEKTVSCGDRSVLDCFKAAEAARLEGNLVTSAILYEEICEGGHPGACNNLGMIKKKQVQYPEAQRYFQKSCDGGLPEGCLNLAAVHLDNRRLLEGLRIYENLCEKNVARGCYNVGVFEGRTGTRKRAMAFYRKACELGEENGCYNLGVQLDRAIKEETDQKKKTSLEKDAENLFLTLCEGGDSRACYNLAVLYYRQKRNSEAKFFVEKAKKDWTEKCDQDDQHACSFLKIYVRHFERTVD